MKNNKIRFSIVVCTHNGGMKIRNCIESLLAQSYSSSKYEIIVVDDGSTDNTVEIVSKYPVNLFSYKNCKGLSHARNLGLSKSRGEIYVCFDDDCYVDTDYLTKLDLNFNEHRSAVGIGSVIVAPENPKLLDQYVIEAGFAIPFESRNYSRNAIDRIMWYLTNQIKIRTVPNTPFRCEEIYGASSSFPVNVLRRVQGWKTEYSGTEDVEICKRINQEFPDRFFYCDPKLKIYHDHKLNISSYYLKHISRAKARLNYYRDYRIFPPIFPGVIIYGIIIFLLILNSNLTSIYWGLLFVAPYILYPIWIIKFILTRRPSMLLFPFFQLAEESSFLSGLLLETMKAKL